MKSNKRVLGLIIIFIMLITLGVGCEPTPTPGPKVPVPKGIGTPMILGTLLPLGTPNLSVTNYLGTPSFLGTPAVPTTEEYAPFCPATYTPLCEDPNVPSSDTPCTPGAETGSGGNVTLAGIGCPLKGLVRFDFDSNGGGNTDFSVEVEGNVFTCTPSPTKPDVFTCTGPEQPMGEDVKIVVCGGEATSTPTPVPAAYEAESGITLASYLESDLLKVRNKPATGGGGGCLDGYIWKPDPNLVGGGECVLRSDLGCPEDWFVSALGTCATDKENTCPEGTTYSRADGGCSPDGSECPPGWIMTWKKTCEPEQNDRLFCPRGYYYNPSSLCCQPIQGDNYECDENSYFDFSTKVCLPIDGNRCGINQVYDNFGKCVGIPGQAGLKELKPAPGLVMRIGDLLGSNDLVIDDPKNNDPDCGADATYVAAIKNCVKRDENGCPYGYHFDNKLEYCIPDDGPASNCPLGYRYQERLGCCVPLPGFSGARCPEDEKLAADLAAVGDLTFEFSRYDPGEGICSPFKAKDGPTPTPVPGGKTPDCRDYEYFDKELGYCVPLGQDCCQQGYGLSCIFNKCMPFYQDLEIHNAGSECDEGYELVRYFCVLDYCPQEGAGCTVLVANVPRCIGGCEVGTTMINGRCVKGQEEQPTDPCAAESCNTTDAKICISNSCCTWNGRTCTKK